MPSKMGVARSFRARVESIRIRLDALSSLRKMVALPPECDISDRQWRVLESQLASAQSRILSEVKRAASEYLPQINDVRQARKCNAALGEIEMNLSRSFTFFDTYMRVLQNSPRRPRD